MVVIGVTVVVGCTGVTPREPGVGNPLAWDQLAGWQTDSVAEAWPGLIEQCRVMVKKPSPWPVLCTEAMAIENPTDQTVRQFLQAHFTPYEVIGTDGLKEGLITGYYEPLLQGSEFPDQQFKYPVFAKPNDMLIVDLAGLYPDLKNKRIRGRVVDGRVVPYYDREEIDSIDSPLSGQELLWVDDPYQLFFLHIQGSGRVQMRDGRIAAVGYADQNGHPYRSIGKLLIERNELKREDVSLFTIRQWLLDNPDQAQALLNDNPSYVFFQRSDNPGNEGPRGSLNVPLRAERAVAVDRSVIPLGSGVWLETTLPGEPAPWHRLMWAQDTGGAIKGAVRADVFFGRGERAERLAGTMKQSGRIIALFPTLAP